MWDFGQADSLEPEAIGEPGQRTFRVRVLSGSEAASLWLEKEQLATLTMHLRQLLAQTTTSEPASELDPPAPASAFPDKPQVDFKIGRLGIGYDEARRTVAIFAYEMELAEDAPPTFSCQVSRDQCRAFADRAEEVVSGGRPVCLLCGSPIESGEHSCGRRNGHAERPISLERD